MNREPYLAELAAKQPSQAKGDKSAGCMPAYNHSWFAAKCKRTVPELLVDQNSWPSLNCVRVTNGWFEYGATVAPVASISVACNNCTVCNLKGAVAAVLGLLVFIHHHLQHNRTSRCHRSTVQAILTSMSTPGGKSRDLFDNQESQLRYEAYSRLQAAAVAFGDSCSLPIPEIVAIGGQSDGKSSLMEAFLGVRQGQHAR
jgi:hypothetical protein